MPRPKKNKQTTVTGTPSAQLFPEKPDTPTTIKKILDDSHSDDEYHSAPQSPGESGFKVNKEYARRFEHNKKREELQRLEEKYGGPNDEEYDSEDDSSSSDDEDEVAVLATEDLDQQISATLAAIKNKDPRLYDGKTTFYSPIDYTAAPMSSTEKKEKPMYLRDYHRENILAGNTGEEEDDEPQTFVQKQDELKRTIVKEMHSAADAEASGEDGDDDGFLVLKTTIDNGSNKIDLPDPVTADPNNPDEYLHQFLSSRVWTKVSGTSHVPLESDDSESDAEAEAFEQAYNMRFEDPNAAARAKLVSYGRDTVNANTVRREEKSRRKRAREEKRKQKEDEKAERDVEKRRLRKLKTDEIIDKIKKIKEAAGIEDLDEEAEADMFNKLLEGDFSDGEWESWMHGKFGDSYYAEKDPMKKPEFDDDIDIKDLIPDFSDDEVAEDGAGGDEIGEDAPGPDDEEEEQPRKKSRKVLAKEKQEKKQKDKSMRRKLERFVEDNYNVDEKLPKSTKSSKFRYRETTPETYGLTPIDILAAGDADLNTFAGLKKYAAFRDPERKEKDRKNLTKKKRLKQWRKEVFGDSVGVKMPEDWVPEGLSKLANKDKEAMIENNAGEIVEGERKKKRRRKNKEK